MESLAWKYRMLAWLILILAVVGVYHNHFHNQFHFDDSHTIENNLFIRDLSNIPRFFSDGTTFSSLPSNQSYRPLLTTTLAIDYALQGSTKDTFWFHVTSFLIFLLQSFPMLLLYRMVLKEVVDPVRGFAVAFLSVCWYMLHPVNAETVNYLIQRGDSLSTLWVMLGFAVYLRWPDARKYHLYLIPVALGALTKPTAIMFGPLLVVYQVLFEEQQGLSGLMRNEKGSMIRTLFKSMFPLAACGVFYLFTRMMEPSSWTPGGASKVQYLITQPYVYYHYFKMFFYPNALSADTDLSPFTLEHADGRLIGGWVFLFALIALMFFAAEFKRLRPIAFGIAWFLLALLPTTVVPLAEVMNDHRMYFPFVGIALAIGWSVYLWLERAERRMPQLPWMSGGIAVLVMLFSGYAYGTYQRNEVWKTEESLWKDVTEKSPLNARGLMNYGLVLMGRGDYAGAEKYYLEGLKLWPNYSYLHINMAIAKHATGKSEEAEAYYKKGVEFGAGFPNNWYFYGQFLYDKKRYAEARTCAEKAISLSNAHIDARHLAMNCCYETGDYAALKNLAESTLSIDPTDGTARDFLEIARSGKSKMQVLEEGARSRKDAGAWLNISLQYYVSGRYEESLRAAEEALRLNPNSAEAYNNQCSALNMLGRYAEGAKACEQALRLKPDFVLAKNNLNWARNNLPKP